MHILRLYTTTVLSLISISSSVKEKHLRDKQGDTYIPTQNLILCIENSVTHFILSVNTNSKELIYNVLLDCSS